MTASDGSQPGPYRCTAFGLEVESDWPLTGSTAQAPAAAPGARVTRVRRVGTAEIEDGWAQSAEAILEHRTDEGAVSFTVERSSEHYRFWLEGFGRYLVASDGSEIACERGAAGERHERFVLAHALPVAAILSGYEVLHASAIGGDGAGAAFVGASGVGKTGIATRLVARGAAFLTDDVLAVEPADDHVRAHPGPAFMSIRPDDAAMIAEIGGRLGAAAGATDKVHVSPRRRGQASPLRVIYHIQWGDTFEIAALERAELHRVLSLSFVPYLTTPERLMRHLAIAQLLGAGVAQFRLQTPTGQLHDEMLAKLEAHMRDAGV